MPCIARILGAASFQGYARQPLRWRDHVPIFALAVAAVVVEATDLLRR